MQKRGKKLLVKLSAGLLACGLSSSAALATPIGYSVNADSGTPDEDNLYTINLETGQINRIALVQAFGLRRFDVEGLAFAPDGTLYGLDDSGPTLFPINPDNGGVYTSDEHKLDGLPEGGGNDFGMTFACDGDLYVTSVTKQSLYRMSLDGVATLIGAEGSLGVKISAIAAFGNPVRLYGLGNGLSVDNNGNTSTLTPSLYEININNGTTSYLGDLVNAQPYTEGGLAFDDDGQLWAITDRRLSGNSQSQVMKVSTANGLATEVKNIPEIGFESLAITVPRGCETGEPGDLAQFTVQTHFADGNDEVGTDLELICNGGTPLKQPFTVFPNPGQLGPYEVKFTVEHTDANTRCEVVQDAPAYYSDTYSCFSEGGCEATAEACVFENVQTGIENLCVIRNAPTPVGITVEKEWEFMNEELVVETPPLVGLVCEDFYGGDGEYQDDGSMAWTWVYDDPEDSNTAYVQPDWQGDTVCYTTEYTPDSAVESSTDCENPTEVPLGTSDFTCTVTNTVFFEGIPTLNQWGLIVLVLLTFGLGAATLRRA